MTYATEDIIEALKRAREAKGLSQRALSARTGVPQSHISKIETGGTDIRLSSLIELARMLDLELKLVPRKAVPAVENIVRSTTAHLPPAHFSASAANTAQKELNRTLEAAKSALALHPDIKELASLQDSLQSFKNLQTQSREFNALIEAAKTLKPLQKELDQIRKLSDAVKLPSEQLKALKESANTFERLRNQLAHTGISQVTHPRPAYRLDEGGEDGDA